MISFSLNLSFWAARLKGKIAFFRQLLKLVLRWLWYHLEGRRLLSMFLLYLLQETTHEFAPKFFVFERNTHLALLFRQDDLVTYALSPLMIFGLFSHSHSSNHLFIAILIVGLLWRGERQSWLTIVKASGADRRSWWGIRPLIYSQIDIKLTFIVALTWVFKTTSPTLHNDNK